MKSTVNWFENEKGYGYIECINNKIIIYLCAFREQGKEEVVEIELIKTDTGYKIKNIEET
jgi:cold shock CspA family protein